MAKTIIDTASSFFSSPRIFEEKDIKRLSTSYGNASGTSPTILIKTKSGEILEACEDYIEEFSKGSCI